MEATSTEDRFYQGSKIIAVCKNYGAWAPATVSLLPLTVTYPTKRTVAAHKVEMGGTPQRLGRVAVFQKPNSSVIFPGAAIVKPHGIGALHHEVELGVVIGRRCKSFKASADWREYVSGESSPRAFSPG